MGLGDVNSLQSIVCLVVTVQDVLNVISVVCRLTTMHLYLWVPALALKSYRYVFRHFSFLVDVW